MGPVCEEGTLRMKVVILNYTGFRKNWGSQATSDGLYRWLQNVLGDQNIETIDVIPYPPSHLLDWIFKFILGGFISKLLGSTKPAPKSLFILDLLCRLRFGQQFKRMHSSDLVVFQGEGSIVDDTCVTSLRILCLPYLAKHKYKKNVVSCNQTIVTTSKTKSILKNVFSAFDLNYVREPETLNMLTEDGWTQVGFMPDHAFLSVIEGKGCDLDLHKEYFCVSGSASIQKYDIIAYVTAIHAISKRHKLLPVFMASRRSDRVVARTYEKLFSIGVVEITSNEAPSIEHLYHILSNATFVIGGRYHTAIAALINCTPVILTKSNSHKSNGLSQMMNGAAPFVDYADVNLVLNTVQEIISQSDLYRSMISAKLKIIKTDYANAANQIFEFVKSQNYFNRKYKLNNSVSDFTYRKDNRKTCSNIKAQLSLKANLSAFDRQ
jgi:polysaccharide pyruvyl transferase WcaK-like protein